MVETGARAGEVVALQVADLNLRRGHRHHPPRQGRQGPQSSPSAPRSRRPSTATSAAPQPPPGRITRLWLGDRGKAFTYDALHKTLAMRAERAGVDRLPPAHAPPHRRPPLAGRGRLRGRPDGRGGLDPSRHAPALHPRPGRREQPTKRSASTSATCDRFRCRRYVPSVTRRSWDGSGPCADSSTDAPTSVTPACSSTRSTPERWASCSIRSDTSSRQTGLTSNGAVREVVEPIPTTATTTGSATHTSSQQSVLAATATDESEARSQLRPRAGLSADS